MDLSKYRLTDYKFIDQYINELGEDLFWKYVEKVKVTLSKLKENQWYNISNIKDHIDLFIKISCEYCLTGQWEFSDDYAKIRRIKSYEEYKTLAEGRKRVRN